MSKGYQLFIKFNIKRVYIIMKEREYPFLLIVQTLPCLQVLLLCPLRLQLEHLVELLNSPTYGILCFLGLTACRLKNGGNIFMTESTTLQSKGDPTG